MSKNITIQDMNKIAEERNGKCLSLKYLGAVVKLMWKCNKDHIFSKSPNHIKSGQWCKICNRYKHSVDSLIKLAKSRNGKFLSSEYKGNIKYKWMCSQGHIWETKLDHIIQGKWCKKCTTGLSEAICREYIEQLLDIKLDSISPSWFKNNLNNQMFFDGYCEERSIAFEHNGVQHYESHKFNDFNLDKIMSNDLLKQKLCNKYSVKLIIIPPLFEKVKLKDLKTSIRSILSSSTLRLIAKVL